MNWEPPSSLEERLTWLLVPARARLLWRVARERAWGEAEIALVPRRDRLSLDIGANVGVWAEAMRRHSLGVHAFEPNPKMFRLLGRAAGRGVVAHSLALSDRAGIAELHVPRRARGYSNQGATLSGVALGGAAHRSVTVETRLLDAFGFDAVGLIKIDVEGHELAVIEGARQTLLRCRPNLIVEIEEKHAGRPVPEVLERIAAHGYRAHALDGGILRPVEEIDLGARIGPGTPLGRYIFNWVFLPL